MHVNFVQTSYKFVQTLHESALFSFMFLALIDVMSMSRTVSQLASVQSRPNPSVDTNAEYQGLPVQQHLIEEALYDSDNLALEVVVAWAASLKPPTEVVHIDLCSPGRNAYWAAHGPLNCPGHSV